ncbi:hypothetical protein HMPREF9446_03644 [Bacteroides fluxus YIT 12057]|jgi:hypothetical protein|uniref:Uncharacterized protein n=1 Tax=Bacteroides fluxus YIT 12057 TaxID=763034 RepID=F3PXZ6_9BACE|nr:hypothetical protein HMPREF9446_03644 [Bacteroides fluxus YIT 12057]
MYAADLKQFKDGVAFKNAVMNEGETSGKEIIAYDSTHNSISI